VKQQSLSLTHNVYWITWRHTTTNQVIYMSIFLWVRDCLVHTSWVDPRSRVKTKDYKIGMSCFSTKQATLMWKADWPVIWMMCPSGATSALKWATKMSGHEYVSRYCLYFYNFRLHFGIVQGLLYFVFVFHFIIICVTVHSVNGRVIIICATLIDP
jgi:hypothetical protein